MLNLSARISRRARLWVVELFPPVFRFDDGFVFSPFVGFGMFFWTVTFVKIPCATAERTMTATSDWLAIMICIDRKILARLAHLPGYRFAAFLADCHVHLLGQFIDLPGSVGGYAYSPSLNVKSAIA